MMQNSAILSICSSDICSMAIKHCWSMWMENSTKRIFFSIHYGHGRKIAWLPSFCPTGGWKITPTKSQCVYSTLRWFDYREGISIVGATVFVWMALACHSTVTAAY